VRTSDDFSYRGNEYTAPKIWRFEAELLDRIGLVYNRQCLQALSAMGGGALEEK
jgi:hypothetical protein